MMQTKSWFFSGALQPGNDKNISSQPTPTINELEKGACYEGKQHEEDSASLMAVRKTTTRRKGPTFVVLLPSA